MDEFFCDGCEVFDEVGQAKGGIERQCMWKKRRMMKILIMITR
jgi:hypothetical protein